MYSQGVSFLPSQVDTPLSTKAITTTSSPVVLLRSDIGLFFNNLFYLFGIVLPLTSYGSGPLDELYPSAQNLWAVFIHIALVFIELAFVLSVPFFIFFAGVGCIVYSAVVGIILYPMCCCLNGGRSGQIILSDPHILDGYDKKEGEVWVFVNGVAVG
jgi:hypothetical protein